jgi:long-chain fatty acid transport protein
MKKVCLFTASALAMSSLAFGGSFQLNLQGMRQTAMGGSGVAWPWDVSTIFYNPGGLSRLDGIQAYANLYMVSPHIKYVQTPSGGYSYDTKNHTSTPFAVYVGGPLKKDSKWGVGVGIYTPFGSSVNWGNDWTGRYVSESIKLESIFIQPTVSYKINDMISVGAGFVYAFGSVDIDKAIPVQDANGNDGQAHLSGKANGVGVNLGVQIKATDKLQFGISYRSGVNMKIKNGDATFNVAPSVASNFPNTSFSSQLPLPSIFTIGAGYKVTPKFVVQADIVFAGWKTYDSLKFDFDKNTSSLQNSHDPRLYKNTVAFRIGGNYQLCNKLAIMAGGAYDPTPSQSNYVSPDAVDANRITLSCGATYQPIKKLTVMAILNYTTTARREVSYAPDNLVGAYQIKSLVPGIGVSYNF